MIELEMENQRVERLRLQKLGEDWIQAIMRGEPDRLEGFCYSKIKSTLLTPNRLMNLGNVDDLVAKYREWFGQCTNFKLVVSRVAKVGERLGIFYRFNLRDHGDCYDIEQQVYSTLKEGRVERLHLLCSGFQLVEMDNQPRSVEMSRTREQDPIRDALLEFHAGSSENAAACAVLTPMIKLKLREMQSGQVLEVRVDDPSARGDIEAWSRLSGNILLKVIDDEGPELRFFMKKK